MIASSAARWSIRRGPRLGGSASARIGSIAAHSSSHARQTAGSGGRCGARLGRFLAVGLPLGALPPTQQAVDSYYSPVVSFSGFTSDRLSLLASRLQHEVDSTRQAQVYADWSDYVLDQAWAGAIATSPPLVAAVDRLHGLKYSQLEMLDYRECWLTN
jgi:hypothetical protein